MNNCVLSIATAFTSLAMLALAADTAALPRPAQTCQAVESVEVGDLPLDKLERAYCEDIWTVSGLVRERDSATKTGTNVFAVMHEYGQYIERCNTQIAQYEEALRKKHVIPEKLICRRTISAPILSHPLP